MADDNKIQNPTNPTDDFEEMINDRSGLTGITTNINHTNQNAQDDDVAQIGNSSDFRNKTNEEEGFSTSNPSPPTTTPPADNTGMNMPDISDQNETLRNAETPAVKGEQSISGDMSDPSADDDTLSNAQNMGLGLGEDSEHPQELDIGSDMDKAEEFQNTH
jgi:hypothetical protein